MKPGDLVRVTTDITVLWIENKDLPLFPWKQLRKGTIVMILDDTLRAGMIQVLTRFGPGRILWGKVEML